MSEPKFTPGPWKVGDGIWGKHRILVQGTTDTYNGAVWSVMAHVELLEATDGDGRHWYAPGTAEANAQLIAAAPDMFEALREAEEYMSHFLVSDDFRFRKVREAIAKAAPPLPRATEG